MTRKSNYYRLTECYRCEYLDQCWDEVPHPQENPNGTCKQKDIFREKEESREQGNDNT